MLIYFFVWISFIFGTLNFKNKKEELEIRRIIMIILISIITGLRYQVGKDYKPYELVYNIAYEQNYTLFQGYFEVLFRIMLNLLTKITTEVSLMFFFSSLITFYYLNKSFKIKEKYYSLSFILFFLWGGYSFMLNVVRQAIAASICLYCITLIKNKKYKEFVIYTLLAIGFHKSALVFNLLVLILSFIQLSKKKYLVIYIFIICFIFFDPTYRVIEIISKIPNLGSYQVYLIEKKNQLALGGILKIIILSFFILLGVFKSNLNKDKLYINLLLINLLIYLLGINFIYLLRIESYFNWSNFLIFPILIDQIKNNKNKISIYFIFISLLLILTLKTYYEPKHELIPYKNILIHRD